ncbi:MAG: DNA/RNA nuclease SfsA [Bacteroidota bacterium]
MTFTLPLLHGTLIKRYRRFLADVKLEDGSVVTAHCPNSTTMTGCCEPGRPVVLSDSQDDNRRHPLTWELINMNDSWVSINPLLGRKIALRAIEEKIVPSLSFFHESQREAHYGIRGKIDLILHGMEKNGFVNLFTVTWAENGIALFPDVVNERAEKSLRQLAEIAKQDHHAAAFFFVQRGDCRVFKPAEHVDKDFMKAMIAAQSAGVEFLVYRADVTGSSVDLGTPIPCSLE